VSYEVMRARDALGTALLGPTIEEDGRRLTLLVDGFVNLRPGEQLNIDNWISLCAGQVFALPGCLVGGICGPGNQGCGQRQRAQLNDMPRKCSLRGLFFSRILEHDGKSPFAFAGEARSARCVWTTRRA
jgi:hypothetical protein